MLWCWVNNIDWRDKQVGIKGSMDHTHEATEGMMTEVSDASVENIESSENWYFWKKKIHIAERKNILQWTDIWQISDTYLCDQGDGWWQGLTAEPLHKYWTNICGILGKYLVNFGKYLANIYGIRGLGLMTGIGCCEPSYCLDPTIGPGCHCWSTLLFCSSSSSSS